MQNINLDTIGKFVAVFGGIVGLMAGLIGLFEKVLSHKITIFKKMHHLDERFITALNECVAKNDRLQMQSLFHKYGRIIAAEVDHILFLYYSVNPTRAILDYFTSHDLCEWKNGSFVLKNKAKVLKMIKVFDVAWYVCFFGFIVTSMILFMSLKTSITIYKVPIAIWLLAVFFLQMIFINNFIMYQYYRYKNALRLCSVIPVSGNLQAEKNVAKRM